MSDSVDRVFSHALNTVNKIRTGAVRPPASTRLKLYGLYKQSMEGDVDGIMDKPEGKDEAAHQAREKWDVWKSNAGLSRTEAKRRYITTLISTMRQYASSSPDSRELVDELEFVWDQVKSNVSSSDSSSGSPTHPRHHATGLGISSPSEPANHPLPQSPDRVSRSQSHVHSLPPPPHPVFSAVDRTKKRLSGMSALGTTQTGARTSADLRHLTGSPLSHSVADEESSSEDEGDEFVDAPDSQIAEAPPDACALEEGQEDSRRRRGKWRNDEGAKDDTKEDRSRKPASADSVKWRRRVSTALIRLTAEVAALREQLEQRSIWSATRRGSFMHVAWSVVGTVLKHAAFDMLVLGAVLLWLRHKKDGRLEGAIRVLLGDAVAEVRRVGTGVQREVQKVGLAVVKGATRKKGGHGGGS